MRTASLILACPPPVAAVAALDDVPDEYRKKTYEEPLSDSNPRRDRVTGHNAYFVPLVRTRWSTISAASCGDIGAL